MDTGVISYDPETKELSCTCGNTTDGDGFVTCDENGMECDANAKGGWDGESFLCQTCSANGKFPNIFEPRN